MEKSPNKDELAKRIEQKTERLKKGNHGLIDKAWNLTKDSITNGTYTTPVAGIALTPITGTAKAIQDIVRKIDLAFDKKDLENMEKETE